MHAGKSLNYHKGTVGKNINVEGHSGKISTGNEKQLIGNWGEGNSCFKEANNLSVLYASVEGRFCDK